MRSAVTLAGGATDYFLRSAGLGPSSAFWETQVIDSSFQFCFTRPLLWLKPVFATPETDDNVNLRSGGAAIGSKLVSRHPITQCLSRYSLALAVSSVSNDVFLTRFKQLWLLSLWYDPTAKYPGQPSACLGLHLHPRTSPSGKDS